MGGGNQDAGQGKAGNEGGEAHSPFLAGRG
jgi:hypothetical protein